MPDIRYVPDPDGLKNIMTSEAMEAMLRRRAEAAKTFAEGIAPVDTGEYKASFRVSSARQGTGRWSDRAVACLHNDSDHATAVEYINDDRVLGRAVDHIERT